MTTSLGARPSATKGGSPKGSKGSKGHPKASQEPPRCTKGSPMGSQREPKSSKGRPRVTQGIPKGSKKHPKGSPKAPLGSPLDPKGSPRTPRYRKYQKDHFFEVTFGALSGKGAHAIRPRLCSPNTYYRHLCCHIFGTHFSCNCFFDVTSRSVPEAES